VSSFFLWLSFFRDDHSTTTTIQTSTEKVLGFEEQKKQLSWFDDECKENNNLENNGGI
jgi:hypothetical protein